MQKNGGAQQEGMVNDAYIDRLIDRDAFDQRKAALLLERRKLEECLVEWQTEARDPAAELQQILEQANSAYTAYNSGTRPEKRDLVNTLTSNRLLSGKPVEVTLSSHSTVSQNAQKRHVVAHNGTYLELGAVCCPSF